MSDLQDSVKDLTMTMAQSLGIESNLVSVILADKTGCVNVVYTIYGDYETQLNEANFMTTYYDTLETINTVLYTTSQNEFTSSFKIL